MSDVLHPVLIALSLSVRVFSFCLVCGSTDEHDGSLRVQLGQTFQRTLHLRQWCLRQGYGTDRA